VIRTKGERTIVHDILVKDGDLIVMGGDMQLTHEHEVPRLRQSDTFNGRSAQVPGRINITVRAFLNKNARAAPSPTLSRSAGLTEEQRRRIEANKRRARELRLRKQQNATGNTAAVVRST